MRQACEDIQILNVLTFTAPSPPSLDSFSLYLPHLPLHPAFLKGGEGTSEALCVIIHTWLWPWCFEHRIGEQERNASCMDNVKMLCWHMAKALVLVFSLLISLVPLTSPKHTHPPTHQHNATSSSVARFIDPIRRSVPRHPVSILLNIIKPGIGWVGCGWDAGKGNTFDKWKIICQEKNQPSQLPLTCFLTEMSVLEVKIKSAFVIEIFGQPWMICHYSFPDSFSPESVLGVCSESQWEKSNVSWPGSVAVNSEKSKHRPDQGISCSVVFGLKNRNV